MKKFKFSLQTVHNVREMRREREEFVLSQLLGEVEKTAQRIDELERKHLAAIEAYAGKMRTGAVVNINEIEFERDHIAALDRLLRETRAEHERQQATCRQQTQKVAVAMQAAKVTDRLRESQESRHRHEQARAEQSSVDDLVSAAYARRMS